MPIQASQPAVVPAVASLDYPEWRQYHAVESWPYPDAPIVTTVTLIRCRREPVLIDGQPVLDGNGQPVTKLVDMTVDQEAVVKVNDPEFSRFVIFTVPDLLVAAASVPSIGTAFGAKLNALAEYGALLDIL